MRIGGPGGMLRETDRGPGGMRRETDRRGRHPKQWRVRGALLAAPPVGTSRVPTELRSDPAGAAGQGGDKKDELDAGEISSLIARARRAQRLRDGA